MVLIYNNHKESFAMFDGVVCLVSDSCFSSQVTRLRRNTSTLVLQVTICNDILHSNICTIPLKEQFIQKQNKLYVALTSPTLSMITENIFYQTAIRRAKCQKNKSVSVQTYFDRTEQRTAQKFENIQKTF